MQHEMVTKTDLQDAIQGGRLEFEALVNKLSRDQILEPTLESGWSVKDVIAHVTAWEQRMLGWLASAAHGDDPTLPAPGFTWDEIDELNQQTHERNTDKSLEEVQASFHASLSLIFASLENLTNEELNSMYFDGESDMLWETIAANTYWHYEEHAAQIQQAFGF